MVSRTWLVPVTYGCTRSRDAVYINVHRPLGSSSPNARPVHWAAFGMKWVSGTWYMSIACSQASFQLHWFQNGIGSVARRSLNR